MEPIIQERARANLKLADGGDRKSEDFKKNQGSTILTKVEKTPTVDTRNILSKIANISEGTIHKVKVIKSIK